MELADKQWAWNVSFSPSNAAVKIGQLSREARHIAVDIISIALVSCASCTVFSSVIRVRWIFALAAVTAGRRKILR